MSQKVEFIKKTKLSDSLTIIKLDENLEFIVTLKRGNWRSFASNDYYQIERTTAVATGNLEITKITATAKDGKGEQKVIYFSTLRIFNKYPHGDATYTFYVSAIKKIKEISTASNVPTQFRFSYKEYESSLNKILSSHDTVSDESRPQSVIPSFQSSKNITSKLCQALSNEHFADVILILSNNKRIYSHRCILATFSTVFEKMFARNLSSPIGIKIDDFDAETIQAALEYLYGNTDAINGKETNVFKFASKYKFQDLIDACCSFFEKSVNPSNVCEYIQTAYFYGHEKLKKKCLKILVEKKKDIDPSKFANLPKNIIIDAFCL